MISPTRTHVHRWHDALTCTIDAAAACDACRASADAAARAAGADEERGRRRRRREAIIEALAALIGARPDEVADVITSLRGGAA